MPPPGKRNNVPVTILERFTEKIESWFQDNGFVYAYVGSVNGIEDGYLQASVVEAKVMGVKVSWRQQQRPGSLQPTACRLPCKQPACCYHHRRRCCHSCSQSVYSAPIAAC